MSFVKGIIYALFLVLMFHSYPAWIVMKITTFKCCEFTLLQYVSFNTTNI